MTFNLGQPAPDESWPSVYSRSSGVADSFRQGEILSNVVQAHLNLEALKVGELAIDTIEHPFAIILSQDCDCIQDYSLREAGESSRDRLMPSVLLAEVQTAEYMRSPSNPGQMNNGLWVPIRKNKNERYQFLEAVQAEEDSASTGIPELTVDFRRVFTVSTDELYLRIETGETLRRCRLLSPYLEHFSSRASYFFQRVALPKDHISV